MNTKTFLIAFSLCCAVKSYSQQASIYKGMLDSTFFHTGGFDKPVQHIVIQPDGKYIVAGEFLTFNGDSVNRVVRLFPNGNIDTSFNLSVKITNQIKSVLIQDDGKILVGGYLGIYCNCNSYKRLIRVQTNGLEDTTFKVPKEIDSPVFGMALQKDGKILIGGWWDRAGVSRIARLNSDGSLDKSFKAYGSDGFVSAIVVQSDGKIVAAGEFNYWNGYRGVERFGIVRLHSDGSYDNTFAKAQGPAYCFYNDPITALAIQKDDKVIVSAYLQGINGVGENQISRLNLDGTLDQSFKCEYVNPYRDWDHRTYVQSIRVLKSGKIIVAALFWASEQFKEARFLAAFNSDGSIDYSFNQGSGPNDFVYALGVQSDDKIVIGGKFDAYNNVAGQGRIMRLYTEDVKNESIQTKEVSDVLLRTVEVYPNPAVDRVQVDYFPSTPSIRSFITLVNLSGKEVYHESFSSAESHIIFNLNIEKLEKGIYILKILNNNEAYREKLVIQ